MCGRYSQEYTWAEVHAFSQPLTLSGPASNLQPHYNIAPTEMAGVLVPQADGSLRYERMRWQLVPRWWKRSLKEVPATFNARAEEVAGKPMFRDAFRSRRCIIPASGFFEWSGPKGDRQPWYITAASGELLGFAGLYDRWRNPETGEEVPSCTIIVTTANSFMGQIHDRMPVILDKADWQAWLEEPREDLLKPAPEGLLRRWRVTQAMNSSRYKEADAIEPVEGADRAAIGA
ncbi:SOS response-associated peptidase [Ancylobacter amanitiformis]|uniref:Abasic site processing protein n=1 Tax=Ancylobacter amanitiformis TaxID=217069 RepID=A0ABU0LPN6_9HYPH|nr:SOS response-associated peptidase [Ancylobacter amanitiformis]MDQ0510618.1 putative SOS response-associated peptidase YedK [Ancylobacter amanitiformis]